MYWQRKQSLYYFSTGHPLIASRQTQSLTLLHQWHCIHVIILQLFNTIIIHRYIETCSSDYCTDYLLCAISRVIFNMICVNYNRNAIRAVGLFVEFARGEKNILIIIITSSWHEPRWLRIELDERNKHVVVVWQDDSTLPHAYTCIHEQGAHECTGFYRQL